MKILVFTHIFPYPLNEGGKVAQFGIIEYLCKNNEVVLVAENNYSKASANAAELQNVLPHLKIKILDTVKVQESKGVVAGILHKVNQLQWKLQKIVNKKIPKNFSVTTNDFFIYPTRPRGPEVINQLLEIIYIETPDIIQVDFIDNADIINILPSGIKKVLVHHDLRFSSVRQACLLQQETVAYTDYISGFVQTIEGAFLNRFDAIITFSNDDKEKLSSIVTQPVVESIPFPISSKNNGDINNSSYHIHKLVFIGPYHHHPNYDAVKWYAEEMAAIIYKQFGLKLLVIGNWPASSRKQFLNVEGIEFAGYVEDLNEALNNAAMILPLRIGSGIRTKLLDAFAYGVPVISTSIGCEGLDTTDEIEILMANSVEQFVEAIKNLISDQALVQNLRNNASRFVKQNYSPDNLANKRLEFYKKIINTE